jgi:signal transduction histidine kinase
MLSEAIDETRVAAADAEGIQLFYKSIADGLHALAQPLTILRASVVASNSEEIGPERRRHYLEISKGEVERACELFDSLQDIVIEARSRAERGPGGPDELVGSVERRELP